MKKKGIGILCAVMLTISACGSSNQQTVSEQTKGTMAESETSGNAKQLTKVSLGMVTWPDFMLFYLADETGIFEQNGLDVDIQEFASTTDNSSAFIAGNLDFCTYASAETISPYAQGGDIKVVILADKSNGCEGLVATSDITSIEDLKGKTVATQYCSVDHMFLLTLLQDHGMSIDDINMVDMTIENAGNAFVAGQCDAACIWDPYFSKAKNAGGKVLYSTEDNPDLISDIVATSSTMIEEQPEVVEAMTRSYYEAVAYWKEHPEESNQYMAEKMDVSVEEFESEMNGLIVPDAAEAVEAFTEAEDYSYWGYTQNTVESFMNELGVIETDADCGKMIDAEFVKKIATE